MGPKQRIAFVPRMIAKSCTNFSQTGMKRILDRYISKHYDEVFRYTRYFCAKYNPRLQPDVVINNAYIHCIDIEDNTTDENKVKSYLLNSIKRQILWQNLDTNKQERLISSELTIPDMPEDNHDINHKILIEQKYHSWKSCVDIYRSRLTDNVKITVLEAYFDKGFNTARSMAKHFNITNTSAHYLITDIKNQLKLIYHENQE